MSRGDVNREERLLKKQIMVLNRHLPRRRKTLKELLGEERPHVLGNDGTRHRFKKKELDKISSFISPDKWGQLKLPLYIEISSEMNGSRIKGKLECRVVCRILEKEDCGEEIYIYRADVKVVRRELPTTSQYIFLVK
ncbi:MULTISPECIES: DUF61 family protein [Methanobacterium]|jgi:uncharacterized protein (UPF0216 family)|uniref:UPF0216 protein BRM9_0844 n=1 Tax=Methanobacterium formicicum TaxID=2162 RepID=A0A089ZA33_METFO|nr:MULTISPECIES: DUF61 family protein [Methanobacterium]AIS31661.1 hypothetical protein BRM9_0844 [Methanobacterium formicicum]KUK75056.1 MAG: hypothetical protein XD90_0678 [Methanobacterium sp. 42_16]MDD4810279.1 DUF61 family protein [Methanobacterium formicicum]MDG3548087.1 DUF61 family protein [Methanobacterium formicicum]MDH2660329.1 DUF61 family protein [Methanobacterium formicicum]